MDKLVEAQTKAAGTRIMGAVPTGITKKVASLVERGVRTAFSDDGQRKVNLQGVRFIPSTKVDLGGGAFQVLANVVVEVEGPSGRLGRAESVDSVVTVQHEKAVGQVLRTLTIPALDWMTTKAS